MGMTLAKTRKMLMAAMAVFLTAYAGILATDLQPLASHGDVIELAGTGIALCAFASGIRAMQGSVRIPWLLLAMTVFCWLAGEAFRSYHVHVLKSAPSVPSICDFFYTACQLMCMAAIVAFLYRSRKISLSSLASEFYITLLAAAGFIFIFVIDPILTDPQLPAGAMLLHVSYAVFDLAIISGCMVIFFGSGSENVSRTSLLLLISGLLFMVAFDEAKLLSVLHGYDIAFVGPLAPLAFCMVGISCIMYAEEETVRDRLESIATPIQERTVELARILTPYAILLPAIIFIFARYRLYDFAACWVVFIITVLSIRQVFVLSRDRHLQRELAKLGARGVQGSQIDPLTKLANRRRIDQIITNYREDSGGQALGLLFMDLDLFKNINDVYGRAAGDMALRAVADAIRGSVRGSDVPGRFGGDEFIAILPGASAQAVEVVGKRVMERVSFNERLAEMRVTLSIGGASMPDGGDIKLLLKAADAALYKAKGSGRNKLVIDGK